MSHHKYVDFILLSTLIAEFRITRPTSSIDTELELYSSSTISSTKMDRSLDEILAERQSVRTPIAFLSLTQLWAARVQRYG